MFYDRFKADEILQWASSKNSYVLFSVPFCFFTQSRDYLSNGNYAISKRGPSPLTETGCTFHKRFSPSQSSLDQKVGKVHKYERTFRFLYMQRIYY
jgi:hypothetical protein